MHHSNDIMVVQTSQLSQVKHLEDKVHVLKEKVAAQDDLISNLVNNNLDHLQSNMQLTTHINRSETQWSSNEIQLHSIKGLHKLRRVYCRDTVSGPLMLGSGGDDKEGLYGGEDRGEGGAFILENMRLLNPALRERGLIEQMEEEAAEASLGG